VEIPAAFELATVDSTGADGAGAVKRAGAPDLRLLLAAVAADADAAAATARTDIIVIDGVALAAVEQPPTTHARRFILFHLIWLGAGGRTDTHARYDRLVFVSN